MVDENDPETKREYDAFIDHEKHEPIAERAQDLGNREPAWAWLLATLTLLAGFGAIVRWCS